MKRKAHLTLQDIANHCNVSKTTVSWALRNNRQQLSEDMIARINAAAKELGYEPLHHHAARRLASHKTGQRVLNQMIALIFPRGFHRQQYFDAIFRGIMDGLMEGKYGLLTCYEEAFLSGDVPSAILRGDADGLIVFGAPDVMQQLLGKTYPELGASVRSLVSLVIPLPGYSSALVDDFSGGYQSAAHLLDLGHRHLIFFEQHDYCHQQRHLGYLHAYRERGLDPKKLLHVFKHAEWIDRMETDEVVAEILDKQPEVTGMLANNDLVAKILYDSLHRLGRRVPDDISLIGFDDTEPITDSQGNNILTTVKVPLVELGVCAARLLLRLLTEENAVEQCVTLPTSLVVRGSTAFPRQ